MVLGDCDGCGKLMPEGRSHHAPPDAWIAFEFGRLGEPFDTCSIECLLRVLGRRFPALSHIVERLADDIADGTTR